MRLNINLASQPYEIARAYKQRMTALIALLGVTAVLLLGYIIYQRARSRGINRQLAVVHGQINRLELEEAQARAILGKPTNHIIADQSDFLNELFARKSLSWTRIFSEMEKIVPPNLHVVSMKPEYTKSNDLVLHIVVATDSRERAVELVRRMEKSNHFRQVQVVAEAVVANTSDQTGAAGSIQFDVAAIYVPGTAGNEEAADAGAAKAEKSTPSPLPVVAVKRAGRSAGNSAASNSTVAASPSPDTKAAQNRPAPPGRMRTN